MSKIFYILFLLLLACSDEKETDGLEPLAADASQIENFIVRLHEISHLKSSVGHSSIAKVAEGLQELRDNPVCVPWLVSVSYDQEQVAITLSLFVFESSPEINSISIEERQIKVGTVFENRSANEDKYFKKIGKFAHVSFELDWEKFEKYFHDGLNFRVGERGLCSVDFEVSEDWLNSIRLLKEDPGFILDIPLTAESFR
jgi:hypothetical protein